MSQERVFTVAHNVIHLQEKPSNGAERVSQARMGQTLTALREENGWIWAQGEDTYRGWADLRWLIPAVDAPLTWVTVPFAEVREGPSESAPLVVRLPILTGIHVEGETGKDWTGIALAGADARGWIRSAALHSLPVISAADAPEAVVRWGREFRGTPYLWGGSSSFGLDCSGFVQLCYQLAGITLRRDADIQRDDPRFYRVGQNELQPGDLIFFGKPDRITHVGMHPCGKYVYSCGGRGGRDYYRMGR